MRHLIVRHAHAGTRGSSDGDDLLRPLTTKGTRQSAGVAALLADRKVLEVWSSRATRCVQTVEPLARAADMKVRTTKHLLEGADTEQTVAWLLAREAPIVGSSHGDVVGGLVQWLSDAGVPLDGELAWPKAGTWDLKVKKGRITEARFLPSPEA